MTSLLAAGAWVLDVLFFVLMIAGILFGVWRGFLKGICKLAGTIFAGVIAVTFCVSLQASLDKSFGWTTKINTAIGAPWGKWIMVIVSFVFLLLLVQGGCWAIGAAGTALVDRFAPFRIINMILGGILGAFQMFTILFVLFAIFRWIPSESLHNFISSSTVMGAIYNPTPGSWFYAATNLRGR